MALFTQAVQTLLAPPSEPTSDRPTVGHLLIACSKALSLLEGRDIRHGLRVALLAGSLSQRVGVSPREQTAIVYAAFLHDIGLVSQAATLASQLKNDEKPLLAKHPLLAMGVYGDAPAFQSAAARQALKTLQNHPLEAASLLQALHISEDIAPLIEASHELYEGSGYPHRLAGDHIPLGSRIISLADGFETVLSELPTLAKRLEAADAFFDSPLVHFFDPELVTLLQELLNEELPLRILFSNDADNVCLSLLPQNGRYQVTDTYLLSLLNTMGTWIDAICPSYTPNHSTQTAQWVYRLAAPLGFPQEALGQVLLTAKLQDIGKLAIPAYLLNHAGPLSREEQAIVQMHPNQSQEILKEIPSFSTIAQWACEHHERLNTQGYPYQKRSIELSVAARVLAIADAMAALTSQRPYRPEIWTPLDAWHCLESTSGNAYDSKLLKILHKQLTHETLSLMDVLHTPS